MGKIGGRVFCSSPSPSRIGLKWKFYLSKKLFLFTSMKALQNDEKCFLFYVENPFCSWDIYNFVPTFWLCIKRLDGKTMLISKFMTSKTGQQIIAIHILHNISRSKGNQTMEFGQLIKYPKIPLIRPPYTSLPEYTPPEYVTQLTSRIYLENIYIYIYIYIYII